ncbi:MAG: hypothetical protein AABY22_10920 [Nanoarchaeota archaeon]
MNEQKRQTVRLGTRQYGEVIRAITLLLKPLKLNECSIVKHNGRIYVLSRIE